MNTDYSILIVDDEVDLIEMYQDFLESEGFKILIASSGEEAIKVCELNQNIKLVISDANMGKMSGLDLLSNIKKLNFNIPYFYLSTGDVQQNEMELKDLGVNRLILKPFDLDSLIEIIKKDLN
jgi:CheY-like chemotaxis protein